MAKVTAMSHTLHVMISGLSVNLLCGFISAEYFERLTLSSADENEAQVKSKPKKKKKVSRTIAQADPKKKRKSTAKDQSTRPKKSRLSKSKVGKTKNSGLIVF